MARAKQLKESDLYATLLYMSWCGRRAEKWPGAKDRDSATKAILQEMEVLAQSTPYGDILSCIDRIPDWSDAIIGPVLQRLKAQQDRKELSRIVNSPLYAEFAKVYPLVDGDRFEKEYVSRGGNFTQTAVYLLRSLFRDNQPAELQGVKSWKQSWLQHLPTYQEKWLKELKRIELKTHQSQKEWKELISSPMESTECT